MRNTKSLINSPMIAYISRYAVRFYRVCSRQPSPPLCSKVICDGSRRHSYSTTASAISRTTVPFSVEGPAVKGVTDPIPGTFSLVYLLRCNVKRRPHYCMTMIRCHETPCSTLQYEPGIVDAREGRFARLEDCQAWKYAAVFVGHGGRTYLYHDISGPSVR